MIRGRGKSEVRVIFRDFCTWEFGAYLVCVPREVVLPNTERAAEGGAWVLNENDHIPTLVTRQAPSDTR